jgi:hypothetical protein
MPEGRCESGYKGTSLLISSYDFKAVDLDPGASRFNASGTAMNIVSVNA